MSVERRKAWRFPLPFEQQPALLEINRRRVPVRLLEVSAGGFSVAVENDDVEAEEDDTGTIKTVLGTFPVRVVDQEWKDSHTVLRLARTGDHPQVPPSNSWFPRVARNKTGQHAGTFGWLCAVAVLALIATWLLRPDLQAWASDRLQQFMLTHDKRTRDSDNWWSATGIGGSESWPFDDQRSAGERGRGGRNIAEHTESAVRRLTALGSWADDWPGLAPDRQQEIRDLASTSIMEVRRQSSRGPAQGKVIDAIVSVAEARIKSLIGE